MLQRLVQFPLTRSCLLAITLTASTQASAEDRAPGVEAHTLQMLVQTTIEQQIIGGFQAFETRSRHLQEAIRKDCKTQPFSWENSQPEFRKTMQSWQRVQHWRTGPMELFLRSHAVQFWPDKKGYVNRHLDDLLARLDASELDQDRFTREPVSVRGLPALEMLLFDSAYLPPEKPVEGVCQISQAIAEYLATTAGDVAQEWRDEARTRLATSQQKNWQDEARPLVQAVIEQLEVITESKIERVLVASGEDAKPGRLESWRSGESLANIQSNLSALHESYAPQQGTGIRSILSEQQAAMTDRLWQQAESKAQSLSAPLANSLGTPETQKGLTELHQSIRALRKSLEEGLAAQGFYLGFNSRDGD